MLTLRELVFPISDRFSLGPISLQIPRGKHVAVIGESGCGKTTLLKLIYGLYDWPSGTISWNDDPVTGPSENLVPGMKQMKYLSQDFDLMPFTSVEENVQKFLSRLYPKESAARTAELLEVVEMTPFAKAHVKTLSGGQKQRVALAQTLAKEPELLLLDEPFSHIDNFRKNKLRRRLFAYLKKQHITCLVATHDATDVLSYMDETIAMKDGKVIAHDATEKLYRKPPSYYVGSLFGDINELPKRWFYVDADEGEMVLLYPWELVVGEGEVTGTVQENYFKGNYWLVTVLKENFTIIVQYHKPLTTGEVVGLSLKNDGDL